MDLIKKITELQDPDRNENLEIDQEDSELITIITCDKVVEVYNFTTDASSLSVYHKPKNFMEHLPKDALVLVMKFKNNEIQSYRSYTTKLKLVED